MTNLQELYQQFLQSHGISIDSRSIQKGDIFFALQGENFDGNAYAEDALIKGARFAVIDNKAMVKDHRYLLVDNTLKALQQLATHHRKQFDIPVIGLTGSNGKTTTKELVSQVLSKKYHVLATIGNLNNHIGVPLTLLKIKKDTEIAVVEMGANHIGEIAALCEIAMPTHGLITNIGKAHLEGFGGFDGVLKAKTELYDFLRDKDGSVFVNADDPVLMKKSSDLNRITYGADELAHVRVKSRKSQPVLELEWLGYPVKSNLYGTYNSQNITAAICIGNTFHVEERAIIEAIADYIPDNSRSQLISTKSNTIYLDAYNANPTSMQLALKNFIEQESGNKYLILGDMLELGHVAEEEHNQLVSFAKGQFEHILLVGPEMVKAGKKHGLRVFPDTDSASHYLKEHPIKNADILIKGSRGIALEQLLKYL
jgi:UDP-N-acetylmuramoyl-tripeptide--D-alanyl-D-alanine ligase